LDVSALSFDEMIAREWLATNALGGYASSTVPGLNTRKYHGLLVAALAPPVRRMVLLSRVEETLVRDGWPFPLASNEYPGAIHPEGYRLLRAFSHDPFPRWAYQGDGWALEKCLHLLRGENTVCLSYTLLGGEKSVEMELRPLLALRPIHDLMYQWQGRLTVEDGPGAATEEAREHLYGQTHRIPPTGRTPEVFFAHDGVFEPALEPQPTWYFNTIYRREQERGYRGLEDLWMPGAVKFTLWPGKTVNFVCSTEPIDLRRVVGQAERRGAAVAALSDATPPAPKAGPRAAESDVIFAALARAADQFVARLPRGGETDAGGVAVISQYPWAAPSPREALVAFGGLFCATGRHAEGRALLTSLVPLLRDGLLPSELPEDGSAPLYRGADVSLWFVHAVHQYLRQSGDEPGVLRDFYEPAVQVIDRYTAGTGLGIETDPDGLLCTGEAGVGTTWMDARTGDWVVTPRAGRPVELNALWYNALCVAADLAERAGAADRAAQFLALSVSVKDAFNRRFWNADLVCCYDVVANDGNDASIRPNQLLAASLPYAVLGLDRHEFLLEWATTQLLTPYGVRTLVPDDPNYQGRYGGGAMHRDKAYHNGSAFPWLLGPLVSLFVKVRGRGTAARAAALAMLRPCIDYLNGPGTGQLCELFDGNAPHAPGGAPASAAAVGEVLRCYADDIADDLPTANSPALTVTLGDLSNVMPAPPATPKT
jgi:predicted glycogen debranching enzyme